MLGTLLQNNSYYTYMHISDVRTTNNNKNSAVTSRVRPCVPFTCFPRKNPHSTPRTLKIDWTGVPRKNSTTPLRAIATPSSPTTGVCTWNKGQFKRRFQFQDQSWKDIKPRQWKIFCRECCNREAIHPMLGLGVCELKQIIMRWKSWMVWWKEENVLDIHSAVCVNDCFKMLNKHYIFFENWFIIPNKE